MRQLLLVPLLVLMLCSAACAAEGIALVKNASGDVSVKRAGEIVPVKQGDRLQAGDLLITGSGGRVGVIFHDRSVLSLKENSFLQIKDFVFKPIEQGFKFNLFLKKGAALFESGKIGKLSPDDFTFEIPEGSIGIRGTKFLIEVN